MPITLTSAVIHSMTVRFVGGNATEMLFEYTGTNSNGEQENRQYSKTATPAQSTSIVNFVDGLIAQFQTDTNLTITIG